ncbi:hypothetical protein LSTR_LSTR006627 [Laodelphax striatellus]|uniref:Uncharacterized protein n=1 Tax=Laodelphax striatellus TaxID=195883 RepID=A0A482X8A5_LAOST|nr:hypothetical protein LSTR_LSTR006627 [Laodelphax striatellus]
MPEKTVVMWPDVGLWNFEAIYISADYLESCVRAGGNIRVNVPVAAGAAPVVENWSVTDGECVVMAVFEAFEVRNIPQRVNRRQVFERNASNVELRDSRRRIIFLSNTEGIREFCFLQHVYPINVARRHGANVPAADRRAVNNLIQDMVRTVITYPTSLRKEFDHVFGTIMNGGGNWLEVDMLLGLLTIRYPPRLEGRSHYVGANVPLEKIHQGAPCEVLAALGLVEAGNHIDTTAYSKDICVNAFDMVTAPREVAHNTPVITMGEWSNIAEIAITLRLAWYDVFNVENKIEIANRVRNCALDHLQRMGYLQRAFEEFKQRSALLSLPRLHQYESGEHWARIFGIFGYSN